MGFLFPFTSLTPLVEATQSKISVSILLVCTFQELVNDAECKQISKELSGAESTHWPQFYHAESERLLGLVSKGPLLSNTLGF